MNEIILYCPKLHELEFKKKMLADEKTMSYNHAYGGTIEFNEDRWSSWYERWMKDEKHFYRYLRNKDTNEFVGEVALHMEDKRWMVDVLIYAPYRNKGYGQRGLELLMEEAKKRGIQELYDEIAADNPSISLFLKNGFEVINSNSEIITVRKGL